MSAFRLDFVGVDLTRDGAHEDVASVLETCADRFRDFGFDGDVEGQFGLDDVPGVDHVVVSWELL